MYGFSVFAFDCGRIGKAEGETGWVALKAVMDAWNPSIMIDLMHSLHNLPLDSSIGSNRLSSGLVVFLGGGGQGGGRGIGASPLILLALLLISIRRNRRSLATDDTATTLPFQIEDDRDKVIEIGKRVK